MINGLRAQIVNHMSVNETTTIHIYLNLIMFLVCIFFF